MMADEKPNQKNDVLVDEASYEELRERLFNQPQPKAKIENLNVPYVSWSSVAIPPNATDLQKLTYVPGVVGEITEWIVRSATRPNRMMALGVATAVVGTIIGRRVCGPTESATHVYLVMLAPTGYGKDWPLKAGQALLRRLGRRELIGPDSWSSDVGFQLLLQSQPLLCCFVDELGDMIALLNSQDTNRFVSNTLSTLKRCYNAWEYIHTPQTKYTPMVEIVWPVVSIIAASTPESFFSSLVPRDVEGGLANRCLPLPYEGLKRPAEQEVPSGAREVPPDLLARLKALPRASASIMDQTVDGRVELMQIGWGPGAKELYYSHSRKMDNEETSDRRRYELGMRVCENAIRLATNIAIGRGSTLVEVEDMQWGLALAHQAYEAIVGGVRKYMIEYLHFPKFCMTLTEAYKSRKFIGKVDLHRDFFQHQKTGMELERANVALIKQGLIEVAKRYPSTGGPAISGWKWIGD
jgi:hypothetical protein